MGVGCFELSKYAEAGQYFWNAYERTNEVLCVSLSHSDMLQPKLSSEKTSKPRDEYDEGMKTFPNPIMIHVDLGIQDAAATVLYNMGQLLTQMGEVDQALAFLLRALQHASSQLWRTF